MPNGPEEQLRHFIRVTQVLVDAREAGAIDKATCEAFVRRVLAVKPHNTLNWKDAKRLMSYVSNHLNPKNPYEESWFLRSEKLDEMNWHVGELSVNRQAINEGLVKNGDKAFITEPYVDKLKEAMRGLLWSRGCPSSF
jgi:hypothetical protein